MGCHWWSQVSGFFSNLPRSSKLCKLDHSTWVIIIKISNERAFNYARSNKYFNSITHPAHEWDLGAKSWGQICPRKSQQLHRISSHFVTEPVWQKSEFGPSGKFEPDMTQKCSTGATYERVFLFILPEGQQENISNGSALGISLPSTCHMPKGIRETWLNLLSWDHLALLEYLK